MRAIGVNAVIRVEQLASPSKFQVFSIFNAVDHNRLQGLYLITHYFLV